MNNHELGISTLKHTEIETSQAGGSIEVSTLTPLDFRSMVRRGDWRGPSEMACHGYASFNLAIIPEELAFEFLLFCQRNPRACAVEYVTEPGNPQPTLLAPEADLKTDLPKYRVFEEGRVIEEPTDIKKYWRDDLVAFLIGTSQNFNVALDRANVHYRMLGAYKTNIPCYPAGRFHGNMAVVSELFESSNDVVRAVQISSRYPAGHGPPIHIGDPSGIGIRDLSKPDITDFGQKPPQSDEIAAFWGCGVTPALVAMQSKIPFMITHCPAHVFISDRQIDELAVL